VSGQTRLRVGALLAAGNAQVGELFPGYFALVMATGTVSLACHLLGAPWIAWPLYYLNIAAYAVLWGLTLTRIARHRGRMAEDVYDPLRGPGFFTIIAATCILGNQVLVLSRSASVAASLWCVALALWFTVMYGFFTAITIREEKPPIEKGLSGAWLLAVVATQAICLLGVQVAPSFASSAQGVLALSLIMHMIGCMLYILIISLIFYRWTFFNLAARALTPNYWINMGAVAITTRSAVTLIAAGDQWPFLNDLQPFLKGFALFYWSTATWWIPLLVALTLWRHLHMKYPLAYDPQYWALAFPLAMYTVCTLQLSQIPGLEMLGWIPHVTVYAAVGVWVIGFSGLLHNLLRGSRAAIRPSGSEAALAETFPR
jgi:tellurite resistance protein TehA-like permease